MWNKLQEQRHKLQERGKAAAEGMHQRVSSSVTSAQQQQPLPSIQDRLALYRRVETAVEQRCAAYATLLDPRFQGGLKLLFADPTKSLPPERVGVRRRQVLFWRQTVLPTVASSLLLELHELWNEEADATTDIATTSTNGDRTTASATTTSAIQQPWQCLTLLMSNLVLVSENGNYDARVRSILKEVGVELLQQHLDDNSDDDQLLERLVHHPSRRLYFLKQRKRSEAATNDNNAGTEDESESGHADENEEVEDITDAAGESNNSEGSEQLQDVEIKEETKETNNNSSNNTNTNNKRQNSRAKPKKNKPQWEQSIKSPPISPRQHATLQFEALERAIATDMMKEMVERAQLAEQQDNNPKKGKMRERVVRGLQISAVGVVVGSLFAVTGGLAAPGLVAAVTALGIHGSVVFATLTTTTALVWIFCFLFVDCPHVFLFCSCRDFFQPTGVHVWCSRRRARSV